MRTTLDKGRRTEILPRLSDKGKERIIYKCSNKTSSEEAAYTRSYM